LIELLVVIAIIGILSGLIVVSMSGVTQKATMAKAQVFSNSLRNSLMLDFVSEYKFDGDTADSWKNNDGTWSGPTGANTVANYRPASECVSGQCLDFDGTDDYVNYGNRSDFNSLTKFTLSAWVYMRDRKYIPTVIAKGPETANQHVWWGIVNDGRIFLELGTGTIWIGYSSSVTSFTTNQWYYIVTTLDNDVKQIKHYKDGNLINAPSFPTYSFNSGVYDFQVGNYYGGSNVSNYTFNGKIDEIRFFNEAISASQIKEQYYAGLNQLLINSSISKKEYVSRINEMVGMSAKRLTK
jgi:type II secretory pathway pseudopilin PulG